MTVGNFVAAIQMISRASTTLISPTTWYIINNASGLAQACFMLRIINDSDVDVLISKDATNAMEYVPSGRTITLSTQVNALRNPGSALFAKGTKFYAQAASAGSRGRIYLVGYYQI